jgi:hypothetical protein
MAAANAAESLSSARARVAATLQKLSAATSDNNRTALDFMDALLVRDGRHAPGGTSCGLVPLRQC